MGGVPHEPPTNPVMYVWVGSAVLLTLFCACLSRAPQLEHQPIEGAALPGRWDDNQYRAWALGASVSDREPFDPAADRRGLTAADKSWTLPAASVRASVHEKMHKSHNGKLSAPIPD